MGFVVFRLPLDVRLSEATRQISRLRLAGSGYQVRLSEGGNLGQGRYDSGKTGESIDLTLRNIVQYSGAVVGEYD